MSVSGFPDFCSEDEGEGSPHPFEGRIVNRRHSRAPFGSCNGTRTALANWDTRISRLRP